MPYLLIEQLRQRLAFFFVHLAQQIGNFICVHLRDDCCLFLHIHLFQIGRNLLLIDVGENLRDLLRI